ncbi:MAG TPA: S8 family serine peptidase [Vicinamibacterales bacterium]|nr:S8 family serine peptidase [Vicinamibacterales bacterium]
MESSTSKKDTRLPKRHRWLRTLRAALAFSLFVVVFDAGNSDRGLTAQASADAPLAATRAERLRLGQTELINGREAIAGDVLIRFREGRSASRRAQLERAAATDSTEAVGRTGLRRLRSRRMRAAQMLSRLRAETDVEFVEPNYVVGVDALPGDSFWVSMWGLQNTGQTISGQAGIAGADIDAPQAWDVTTGTRNVVVGVIDTGIDYNHPDLAANMWRAPAAFTVTIAGQTITCAAGSRGFNAITRTCDPMDDHNHGTHVAGTIGAVGGNGIGVSGVNWATSMMGLKFLASNGFGSTANAIHAIDFAIQAKAAFAGSNGANVRILSNSWGGGGFSQALADAIGRANSAEMLFVAAAGNDGSNNDVWPTYPANYNVANVLSVAATDNRDGIASFSNYGTTTVDLGAPGVGIYSTTRNSTYASYNGTSMATPHVSGAAALMLAACSLSTASLKTVLMSTVDVVPSMTSSVSRGRLNANNAVRACLTGPATPGISLSGDLTFGSVAIGATSTKQIQIRNIGSAPLAVSNITLPAGYSTTSLPLAAIAPNGSATVHVHFTPTAVASYSGTMTVVANHSFGTNTLAASGSGICVGSLSASEGVIRAAGGSLSLSITTANVCAWTASTSASWIHTSGGGPGSGTITLSVDANTGTTRVATVSALGATYTLTQLGVALPSVTATDATSIAATGATAGGIVTSDGGSPVTARGVVWSTSPNPTLADSFTSNGTGTGAFSSPITGLAAGTTYYFRAYATNAAGTAYSESHPSILWRKPSTGQNVMWRLDGLTRAETEWLESANSSWHIAGVADFSADTKDDIVWRNYVTGETVVWLMDGTTRLSTQWLESMASAWLLRGADDFNGDGRPDLVWRHRISGETRIWLMNGTSRTSSVTLPLVSSPSWWIGALGDFDGNGGADIVWRHLTTGENVIWLMNGTTRLTTVRLDTVADMRWTMIGTASFGGDGRPDILWRNTVNGENVAWDMDATMRLSTLWLDRVIDFTWEMAGAINSRGHNLSFTTSTAPPTVTTGAVSSITPTTAVVTGYVTSTGGTAVLARGVCRSLAVNPTTSDTCVSATGAQATYAVTLGGLSQSTLYHVRAFATTSAGTAYGADVTFTTAVATTASVSSLSPTTGSARGGTLVTLIGTNFANGATVAFGGASVASHFVSSTVITAITPSHAAGVVDVAVTNPGASTATLNAAFTYNAVAQSRDFNDDGRPDLVWRHAVTGQNMAWHLDGGTTTSRTTLPPVPDLRWHIIGAADFNGDGEVDILWRNVVNGENVVWYMNGASRLETGWLPSVPDQRWRMIATADFNRDDHPDILWRNSVSGENVVWIMNGLTRTATEWLPTVTDMRWQLSGAGDFNGDGSPDIVWRNNASGENAVWFLDGVRQLSTGWLPVVPDLRWTIAANGDFNSDGFTDLVWRNSATGDNVIWSLNGITWLETVWLERVADLDWRIVGQ